MASNGHDPDRLDRLESLVEVLFRHLEFEEEHNRLLIAQVVLADRMDRIAEIQAEGAQRMNVLIAIVDEVICNRRPQA